MVAGVKNMTGEQLLLMNVLYWPEARSAVECELDRRAVLEGARPTRPCRHARRPIAAMRRRRSLVA